MDIFIMPSMMVFRSVPIGFKLGRCLSASCESIESFIHMELPCCPAVDEAMFCCQTFCATLQNKLSNGLYSGAPESGSYCWRWLGAINSLGSTFWISGICADGIGG